jgi:type II secretory pathway component PulF
VFDAFLRLVTPLLRLLGLMPSKVKTEVLFVARALSTLQHAGAPVLRSLRVAASDLKPGKVKDAVNAVVKNVESGYALSEALGQHPDVFDNTFVNMVAAGEAGGALEVILARLVHYLENPGKGELARSLRILGTMISSGVPVLQAIVIVRDSSSSKKFADLWQAVFQSIREGDTIAEPLKKAGFIPNIVVTLVEIGEETGDLDTTLYNAADWCEATKN